MSNSINKPSATSNVCSRTNGTTAPRSRPQSTPVNGGQSRNKQAAISVAGQTDQTSSESNNTKTMNDLSSLKGVDKRILELILDNIYKPNTKITFDDISGLVAAKQALREIGKLVSEDPAIVV